MKISRGRAVVVAFAAEVLGILALVLIVAAFGPSSRPDAAAFAGRMGSWVGPMSGAVLCCAGGFMVARTTACSGKIANGLAVGVFAASIDLTIAIGMGMRVSLLLGLSNVGRLLAGALGGWLSSLEGQA